MIPLSTWYRYISQKCKYSVALTLKNYRLGDIPRSQVQDEIVKNMFQDKLTYVHRYKKHLKTMTRTIVVDGSLLVRKLPEVSPVTVFVGDVVLLRDPEAPLIPIIRRLAAIEGYEMVSTDEKDEPFVLENDQCWVLFGNQALKPMDEGRDSRTFGPISLQNIVGRVIYNLKSLDEHGPVINSRAAMQEDQPVLAVELDIREMARRSRRTY